MMPQRAMMGGSALSLIKSIQTVTITLTSGNTSATGTIANAVNTGSTALIYQGLYADVTNDRTKWQPRLDLTNSTTITAYVEAAATGTIIIQATVIEFQPQYIKSMQYGSIVIGSGASSNTATITSVDTANTGLLFLGCTSTEAGSVQNLTNQAAYVTLTNSTTVTATRSGTTYTCTAGFCVVEFIPGVLKSVQTALVTIPQLTSSATASINPVNTATTMLFNAGFRANAFQADMPKITLTDEDTITSTRHSAPAFNNSCATRVYVMEFHQRFIRSVQRGESYRAISTDPLDVTITAVNLAKSIINYLHFSTENSSASIAMTYSIYSLSSSTNARFKAYGAYHLYPSTYSWEVIEFV